MIKLYLKQAWALLKQNPLFSTLYVAGTGLAIAMTMIVAVVYYVKLAPVYPETNREHTLYITQICFNRQPQNGTTQWFSSYKALQEWFYPLKNAEVVSATMDNFQAANYIQPSDNSGDFPVEVKLTDPAFFRIYSFQFLWGKPFTQSDFSSGIRSVVITDDLARRLFGTEQAVVGRTFKLNYIDTKVAGVVRSASYLTSESFAQIYIPYTTQANYSKHEGDIDYLGKFKVTLLVESADQEQALRKEIGEIIRKTNLIHAKEWTVELWNQPTSHALKVFQGNPGNSNFSVWGTVRYYLLILLVLLLVPALNLSGMISSRMETRLAEMGVRKSFGASRSRLLRQVMWENLLLTLLGGLLGMLLAWSMLYGGRMWIFSLFESWPDKVPEGVLINVSGEMLFAPIVFAAALLLCVVLNLLSALIPAWRSLHKPIVYSMNEKR